MKLKRAIFLFGVLASHWLFAQNTYQYKVDLVTVEKDLVKVTLIPPKTDKTELQFIMPKAVPGSYAVKDYGRFIKKFTAYDAAGAKLKTKQKEYNVFTIANADKLVRIEYWVDDTWDTKNKKNFVFQPGGTNTEVGLNYVINPFCYFGYFDGYKMNPYELEITKPEQMFGSGFLPKAIKSKTIEVITAPNYVVLADNPIMYSVPDTTSISAAGCNVKISVYSSTGVVKAEKVREYLNPLATALDEFLKGLPVNEYHFIFYFDEPGRLAQTKSAGLSGYGALEHNHSSFYYLPETKNEKDLRETVQHVCGHEFLHLVTPLNLHSKEISNFDFLTPKMSQHLWMYEGVTEYFSELVPLHGAMVNEREFRNSVRSKVNMAEDFGPFSMTDMSRNVLTPKNQEYYESVYTKGAVLAFMLDIQIAELTKGQKNLRSVIMELAQKYGAEKPFDDEELFKDIVALTHPDIEDFINDHIVGTATPDMETIFAKLGWEYAKEKQKKVYFCGYFGVSFNEATSQIVFGNVGNNLFGLQNGDVLVSINWSEVNSENIDEKFDSYFNFNESDAEISIGIKRNGVTKTLTARPQEATLTMHNYIGAKTGELTEAEIALRKLILHL